MLLHRTRRVRMWVAWARKRISSAVCSPRGTGGVSSVRRLDEDRTSTG